MLHLYIELNNGHVPIDIAPALHDESKNIEPGYLKGADIHH